MNVKFHRTSLTPCFNMKKTNIDKTLEKFILVFKTIKNHKRYI